MNLKRLNYIMAIYEEQNITKAAEKLFVTRSAINHHLIDLENDLGMPLFKRLRNKMTPTGAGEIYLDAARKILLIEQQVDKSLLDLRDCAHGTLNLGITRGGGTAIFGEIFPQFIKTFPRYSLNLQEGNALELDAMLLSGNIDMAWSVAGIHAPPLEQIVLHSSEILLALPLNHRLAHLTRNREGSALPVINLKLLRNEQFVLLNPYSRIREITDFFFQKAGFDPHIMFESSTSDIMHQLVKKGACIAFIPQDLVESYDDAAYFSVQPGVRLQQTVSYRKGTYFSEAEQYLIELLKRYWANKE